MRRARWMAVIGAVLAAAAQGGQVYGSLSEGGRAVSGADIAIECAGKVTPGATAGDGSYRLHVPQQGRCTFTLTNRPGRPSAVVFSYPNPTQYDFELVRRGDGGYELRRR